MEVYEEGSFFGIKSFNPEYKIKYSGSGAIGIRKASMACKFMFFVFIVVAVICFINGVDDHGSKADIALIICATSLVNLPFLLISIPVLNSLATITESSFLNKKKLE